jgi:hypothetical protein
MRSVVKSAALVETWFDMLPAQQRVAARELHAAVQEAAPQLTSSVLWGNLVLLYSGASAIAIAPHKSHINLQFFDGAALAGRFPQLEGVGPRVRHLRRAYDKPLDRELVRALVEASLAALP